MIDSNHEKIQNIQKLIKQDGNQISITDLINIALREFFINSNNANNDLSNEENIKEVLKCYLKL